MDTWYTLNKALRPLYGLGLTKLPLVSRVYSSLYHLLSKDNVLRMQGMEWEVNKYSNISASSMALRRWEKFEMDLFLSLLKPGMTVVDVGASFGFYTCLAAGVVGSSGHVYAFEPFIPTYNLLVKNIERNKLGNVTPSSRAVSRDTGWIDAYIDCWEAGVTSKPQAVPKDLTATRVPCVRLDDILTYQVNVVKIDAEGYDLHVIQGMEKIISTNKELILFIEVAPELLKFAGTSTELLLGALEKNFVLHIIREREEKLDLVSEGFSNVIKECSRIGTANLYCKRRTE